MQTLAPAEEQVGPRQEQIGPGGQDGGGRRCNKVGPGQAHAQQQGQQGTHRGEAAAQVVKELPPGHRGDGVGLPRPRLVAYPPAQPGQQLPVPSHPAVEAGKVGVYLIRIAVGELHVPNEPGVEIGALQQVVGEDGVFGEAAVQTGEEGVHVKDALAGVGGLVKQIVVHVTGGTAVGVHPALAGKEPGKPAPVGGVEIHTHPGLEQAVAGGDHPPPGVYTGPVEGVEHGADELSGGAHVQAGVRVQGDHIAHPVQAFFVPRPDGEAGGPPLEQAHQLHQSPPLALPAHVPLVGTVKDRGTEKEIEAAPIGLVKGLHRPAGLPHSPALLRAHGGVAVGQVGQQAEDQLLPRVPVFQAVALQQGGVVPPALQSGEQPGDDAQGFPLGGHPVLEGHPAHRPGREEADHPKVHHVFHQIGHGQQQKQADQGTAEHEAQQQHHKEGGHHHPRHIEGPRGPAGSAAQGLPEEEPAYMPLLLPARPAQLHHLPGRLQLRRPRPAGQAAQGLPVAPPGLAVHMGVQPGGVLAQNGLHPAGPLQQAVKLDARQGPQGGEEGLEGGRVLLQTAAQPGQPLHQRPRQGWGHQGELPLRQGVDPLEPLQKGQQAWGVQREVCPGHPPGQGGDEGLPRMDGGQRPCPLQTAPGLLPLPPGQVPVVQQPLRRRWQRSAPLPGPRPGPVNLHQGRPDPFGYATAPRPPLYPQPLGCLPAQLAPICLHMAPLLSLVRNRFPSSISPTSRNYTNDANLPLTRGKKSCKIELVVKP